MAEIEWYQIEAAVQTNSPYRAQAPDELDHIRAAKNALIRYVSRLAGIVTSWQLPTCWQTHLALDDVMSNSQGMAMKTIRNGGCTCGACHFSLVGGANSCYACHCYECQTRNRSIGRCVLPSIFRRLNGRCSGNIHRLHVFL